MTKKTKEQENGLPPVADLAEGLTRAHARIADLEDQLREWQSRAVAAEQNELELHRRLSPMYDATIAQQVQEIQGLRRQIQGAAPALVAKGD
jgi:hypothetical protein